MERIAHRDLRNRSSEILRRVAAGESFEITNHGVVVAVLEPPSESRRPLRVVKPATRTGRWSDIQPEQGNGRPTQEVLDEIRAERL